MNICLCMRRNTGNLVTLRVYACKTRVCELLLAVTSGNFLVTFGTKSVAGGQWLAVVPELFDWLYGIPIASSCRKMTKAARNRCSFLRAPHTPTCPKQDTNGLPEVEYFARQIYSYSTKILYCFAKNIRNKYPTEYMEYILDIFYTVTVKILSADR